MGGLQGTVALQGKKSRGYLKIYLKSIAL